MNTEKAIKLLNELIQINNDRMEGYQKAMDDTDEVDLKGLFRECAITSSRLTAQLIEEVEDMDGDPIEGTSTSGKLYRIWMDIKTALSNNDRGAILNACEYGEDWAVKAYEQIMHEEPDFLTMDQKEMIRDHYTIIKNDHDTIKHLRDRVNV
jgi:uncharacterized protein (TIGR02284 family)